LELHRFCGPDGVAIFDALHRLRNADGIVLAAWAANRRR
jgi:hypothetical protein